MAAARLPMPSPWIGAAASMLCAFGWAWTLAAERAVPGDAMVSIPAFCGAWLSAAPLREGSGFEQWLLLNPPSLLSLAWLGMLLAMMPPLLRQPAAYLWQRSLSRRRWRAIAMFVAAYFAVWMLAGVVLLALTIGLQTWASGRALPLGIAALAVALSWQAAPARQQALNRCHHQPRIAAFGWRADRDVLRYATAHAGWCIAACWGWMLLPLLAGTAHLPAMLAATVLLAFERTRPARAARWRWPLHEAKLLPRLILRPRRNIAAPMLASSRS